MRRSATKPKPASPSAVASVITQSRVPVWLLAAALGLVTLTLFWPAMRCGFINFDDPLYVTQNLHVQAGVNADTAKWAFLNPVAGNWHPLTMLSLMFDYQLFGLKAWGYHLTNVLLHAANTVLVFLVFRRMTKATWRSVILAALFGLHPLRVESVAWIAERKDVLSTLFWMLTLWAYVKYVEVGKAQHLKSGLWYGAALAMFALGLMSKAILVTVPCVLLLLDYWPLERFQPGCLRRLVREKIPFFALTAVASVVTILAQKQGGAVTTFENLTLGARIENALDSYCRYLGKIIWPTNLAIFYPLPRHWPLATVLVAGGFLAGVSVLLYLQRRRYPYLLVGWLWFVGTLVPVIGLIQVGRQAMADRYTYVPSLGVLVLIVWGVYEATRRWRHHAIALSVLSSTSIILCTALTRQQLGYWRNSETLFRHALAVTKNNYLAHNNLGDALDKEGQITEAIRQFREAIRLTPGYPEAHNNLAIALNKEGQIAEAIGQLQEAIRLEPGYAQAHFNLGIAFGEEGQTAKAISQFQQAIRLKPDFADAHNNLGVALNQDGRTAEAISQFQESIRLEPNYALAHYNLGNAFNKEGKAAEAISQFQEAVRLKPDFPKALNNLGYALATMGRFEEAIQSYRQAIQIDPNNPETFLRLGMILDQLGRTREAVAQYREALRLNPNLLEALNNLAWALATSSDDQLRNGAEALRLAERACALTRYSQPLILRTLAAAYAEVGRFPEAVTVAEEAEKLATSAGLTAVAADSHQLLKLYRAGKPYHKPSAAAPSSAQTLSHHAEQ